MPFVLFMVTYLGFILLLCASLRNVAGWEDEKKEDGFMETCDSCGKEFQLDCGCYIGPREGPQNTDCYPGMDFVSYCPECADKHGFGPNCDINAVS